MRVYKTQHSYYCGVDLHARSLFVNVLDDTGKTRLAQDLPASPSVFLDAVKPYRQGIVVGCECMFAWYWLADLCERESIPFVLGHALAMKAIHGGKAKNDKLDAEKIAGLLRGGFFHSGDAAVVHSDGFAEIRDRIKDVIISGGENISSIEVEGALLRHPAVLEAAVVGMPHEKWGESPEAFVVLNAGATVTDLRGKPWTIGSPTLVCAAGADLATELAAVAETSHALG